ncbi:MAG TPA: HD domain-containing protein [Acidobacteriota bacterium]|nr:HD domain-containing protein [Acidobacteriota bacterium]
MPTHSPPKRKRQLARARKVIEEDFTAQGNALRALGRMTEEIDGIIKDVSGELLKEEPVAMVAIGGYGRSELFPASDVDLLIVHLGEQQEKVIRDFLHRLWDLDLQVGQQVWRMQDLESLDLQFAEFVLALLDARFVAGDEVLGRRFLKGVLPPFLRRQGDQLSQRLIELTRKRHQEFGNTVYQLEPDIKSSPGGLRDYWTAQWLQRLLGTEAFLAASEDEIQRAHEFLCRIRLVLHWMTGRRQDKLTHRLQEEVAETLGFGSRDPSSAVESLMNTYFLSAHTIVHLCRRNVTAVDPPPPSEAIECVGREVSTAADVVGLFLHGLKEGRPLGDSARDAAVQALPEMSSGLRAPRVTQLLRELFQPRPGLYRTLSEMYELGVLEMLFPEFSSIKERVIRDFYHRYTVDEHTLQAIKHCEELLDPESCPDGRFAALLRETQKPELLTLSLLLHDVGKSREGNHAQRSARMAHRALKRLGFPTEDIERVSNLIRDHLAMSNVAFRRDLEDPKVIASFAGRFSEVEQLRLLCLLTYADIRAVGPGILKDWQRDLLFQLYVAAYNHLTRGYGAERISRQSISKRLLDDLPEEIDAAAFQDFLKGFPKRYLVSVDRQEIFQHFRMSARLQEEPVQIRLNRQDERWRLCVLTPDRKRLFAHIAGTLTYFDMNILRGYGFSNDRGLVLDLFQFTDTRDRFEKNAQEREAFKHLLRAVIKDDASISKLLQEKAKSPLLRDVARPFEPTAYFGESDSDEYSILEVIAPDSLGLLHRIGRVLAAADCDIELILISTEGSRAVDVFYLSHQGRALSPDQRRQISNSVLEAIETSP